MERFKMATEEGRRICDTIPPEDKNVFAGITPAPPSMRGRRFQGGRPQGGRRRPGPLGTTRAHDRFTKRAYIMWMHPNRKGGRELTELRWI